LHCAFISRCAVRRNRGRRWRRQLAVRPRPLSGSNRTPALLAWAETIARFRAMLTLAAASEAELVARYDGRGPRYTSYPTAPHFARAVDRDVVRAMARRASRRRGRCPFISMRPSATGSVFTAAATPRSSGLTPRGEPTANC
jgi:hypothetical protein